MAGRQGQGQGQGTTVQPLARVAPVELVLVPVGEPKAAPDSEPGFHISPDWAAAVASFVIRVAGGTGWRSV